MQLNNTKRAFVGKGILLLGIVLIGYILRFLIGMNATISRDGIWYIRYSMGWHAENALSKWHTNDTFLFVYILKQMLLFETNPVLVGLSLNIVLGVCFIVLTFLFIKCLTGNSIASFLCSFLVAVHPTFIFLSADVLRENLFLCLSALSLICAFYDKKNSFQSAYIIAASLFTSCAILTRAEGVLLLPFLVMCILIRHKLYFALFRLSVYLLLSCLFYFFIVQCVAPEHRINILERTISFIF